MVWLPPALPQHSSCHSASTTKQEGHSEHAVLRDTGTATADAATPREAHDGSKTLSQEADRKHQARHKRFQEVRSRKRLPRSPRNAPRKTQDDTPKRFPGDHRKPQEAPRASQEAPSEALGYLASAQDGSRRPFWRHLCHVVTKEHDDVHATAHNMM
jgi:hypothetical protein